MFKFLSLTTHDPILLVTTLILIAALVILAWSLREYFGLSKRKQPDPRRHAKDTEGTEPSEPETPAKQDNENFILMEAHLREMSSQLNEIGRRLLNVEKTMNQKKAADQTIPAMLNNTEMEKFIQRIEARIEGIHKLLIILTNGGSTEAK